MNAGGRLVSESECRHERKHVSQQCNREVPCPQWSEGEWTSVRKHFSRLHLYVTFGDSRPTYCEIDIGISVLSQVV